MTLHVLLTVLAFSSLALEGSCLSNAFMDARTVAPGGQNGSAAQNESDLLHQLDVLKVAEKRADGLIAAKEAELAEEEALEDGERAAVEKEREDIEGLAAAAVEKQKVMGNRTSSDPWVQADPWAASAVGALDLAAADTRLRGFAGGFTDGTYGYAIPHNTGDYHGLVARFDLVTFSAPVAALDLAAADTRLRGFYGGFTDGTYGYAIPYSNGVPHGLVARFDLATFSAPVAALDLAAAGFHGGFTDGTYGYAIPYNQVGPHGTVARFDLATFSAPAALDLAAADTRLKNFHGGFTDGTYGYAIPWHSWEVDHHGTVARFDLATFSAPAALDLAAADTRLKGFLGGFTDGTYGYAIPFNNGVRHGAVVRFDLATFSAPVAALDLAAADTRLRGFLGGFTDGTYGYAIPHNNGDYHGLVARFDLATFSAPVAALDLAAADTRLMGFAGGFTDGTYGYAIPNWNRGGFQGTVARFGVTSSVSATSTTTLVNTQTATLTGTTTITGSTVTVTATTTQTATTAQTFTVTATTFTHPPKPTTTTKTTTTASTVTETHTTMSEFTITTTTATTTTVTTSTSSTTTVTKTTKTRITDTSATSTTGTTTTVTTTTASKTLVTFTTYSTSTGTSTTPTTTTRTRYPKPTETTTLSTITTSTVTTFTTLPETTTTTSSPLCVCGSGGRVVNSLSRTETCMDMGYTGFLYGGQPANCAVMAKYCNDPSYAEGLRLACPVTCCAYSYHATRAVPAVPAEERQQATQPAEESASTCEDSQAVPCKHLAAMCQSSQFKARIQHDCRRTCDLCEK